MSLCPPDLPFYKPQITPVAVAVTAALSLPTKSLFFLLSFRPQNAKSTRLFMPSNDLHHLKKKKDLGEMILTLITNLCERLVQL